MMENRSFDHILGLMKRSNSQIRGVVGNDFSNKDLRGNDLFVREGALDQGQLTQDPGHDFVDVYFQMHGARFGNPMSAPNMSGFAGSYQQMGGKPAEILKCFQPSQVPVITALASEYAVCDQWYSSVPGPTLPNRAFAHFGTSFGRLDMSPDYFRGQPSIYQRMEREHRSAKIYYYASWSGTQGLTFLLADQSRYFGLFDDFLSDCRKGKLPDYAFVEPAYRDHGTSLATDQHPDHSVLAGENFIRQVYKALRSNETIWRSSVLLIVWDEHGGIFDHEIPPIVSHTDGFESQDPPFKFDRLGVRVPAVVVSPYVERGRVDHTVYEHASIPATVTEQFIGDPLAKSIYAREQHANTFLHLLTLDSPRTDTPNLKPPSGTVATKTAFALPVSQMDARISSLTRKQLGEIHSVLTRNHPDLAQTHPMTLTTEEEASKFIEEAMVRLHEKPRTAKTRKRKSQSKRRR